MRKGIQSVVLSPPFYLSVLRFCDTTVYRMTAVSYTCISLLRWHMLLYSMVGRMPAVIDWGFS